MVNIGTFLIDVTLHRTHLSMMSHINKLAPLDKVKVVLKPSELMFKLKQVL